MHANIRDLIKTKTPNELSQILSRGLECDDIHLKNADNEQLRYGACVATCLIYFMRCYKRVVVYVYADKSRTYDQRFLLDRFHQTPLQPQQHQSA